MATVVAQAALDQIIIITTVPVVERYVRGRWYVVVNHAKVAFQVFLLASSPLLQKGKYSAPIHKKRPHLSDNPML